MRTITEYEAYFKRIADYYSEIKDFYHIDLFRMNEFENDLRGKKYTTPLLVLESYDIDLIANGIDNIHDVISGALVLLDEFDVKAFTQATMTEFIRKNEVRIKAIRDRMLLDYQHVYSYHIRGLEPNSLKIRQTDVIAARFQGFRLSFSIAVPHDLDLVESEWTGYTPVVS